MTQRIFLSFLSSLLLVPLVAQAEESFPVPRQLEEMRAELWNSIRLGQRKLEAISPLERDKVPDPIMEEVWRGNNPVGELVVREMVLDFFKKEKDGTVEGLPIVVRREPDAIVVRHPKPRFPRERGGIRFSMDGDSSLLGVFDALPPMAVLAANYKDGPTLVAICPRTRGALEDGVNGIRMLGANFILERAWASVEGSLEATLLSGYGRGLQEASIQVTDGVHQAEIKSDRVDAKDPLIALLYTPSDKGGVPQEIFADSSVPLGLRFTLLQKNSAGYLRVSEYQEAIWTRVGRLPDGLRFQSANAVYDIGAGECGELLIIRSTSRRYNRLEQAPEPTDQEPDPEGMR